MLATADVLLPKDIPLGQVSTSASEPITNGSDGSVENAIESLFNAASTNSSIELLPRLERGIHSACNAQDQQQSGSRRQTSRHHRATLRKRLERNGALRGGGRRVSGFRAWTLVEGAFARSSCSANGPRFPLRDERLRNPGRSPGKILFLNQHLAALKIACAEAGFRNRKSGGFERDWRAFQMVCFVYTSRPGMASRWRPPMNAGRSPFSSRQSFRALETSCEASPESESRDAPTVSVLGGWKTGNYWRIVQAFAAARANGFDEVLVLNIRGRRDFRFNGQCLFCASARCCAPSVCVGARQGVVRAWIKEMTPVDEGFAFLGGSSRGPTNASHKQPARRDARRRDRRALPAFTKPGRGFGGVVS